MSYVCIIYKYSVLCPGGYIACIAQIAMRLNRAREQMVICNSLEWSTSIAVSTIFIYPMPEVSRLVMDDSTAILDYRAAV